ncbi:MULTISPECIES: serine hydrolase domain-containing protein [unclassified Sphingobacterium]|uniref:serine hydrolase domain-containing protein n=1 Tax=unclassified Sphingobacterium TaxID=2609468 RepID=UPI002600D034|nr:MULTISPECIES: serine hydrolase domain-containing protein [unclassified Sphingobacterium]
MKIHKWVIAATVCSFLGTLPLYGQYKSAVKNESVLLLNQEGIIPLKKLDDYKIVIASPSSDKFADFIAQAERYTEFETKGLEKLDESIKYANTVIIPLHDADITDQFVYQLVQARKNNKKIILVVFGNGSGLTKLNSLTIPILFNTNTDSQTQKNAAMTIFGGISSTAKLDKTYSFYFQKGAGFNTNQTRLQYTEGQNSSLNLNKLTKKIDEIAAEAISKQATPGAVVMIIKDGQVIFEKGYGYHTYDKKTPTTIGNIFDLASVSKIAGTTPVIMRLTEQHVINLDSTIGDYLYQAQATNKKNISLRSVMLHEAGFTPFIPFYRNLKPGDLERRFSASHQVKVADSCYLLNNYYRDVMWPEMLNSPVKPVGNYVYSDISMYVMKEVAEHQTGVPMQDYVQKNFYKPLGMKTAGYLPRDRFAKENIIPTEHDTSFRKVLLQGYVHDQGAAMAGGVAGHAGLFATANDLAIYGQLLLNRGEYGGNRYFKGETVDLFTSKQSATSRRGLGFDRWDPNPKNEYPSKGANSSVYGHTGYTGTCIWIDPSNQLIYIFLSNRVHPQVSSKLLDLNIRSRIQDAIYETLDEVKK